MQTLGGLETQWWEDEGPVTILCLGASILSLKHEVRSFSIERIEIVISLSSQHG